MQNNLLTANIKNAYYKYLSAAFGSALIICIYCTVDTAVVGHYAGPNGISALAIVMPIWTILYSLGTLTGIGGSILFSTAKGKDNMHQAQQFFTAALYLTIAIGVICWLGIWLFEDALLRFFGANEILLPIAKEYLLAIKFVIPLFPLSQMLAAFLRNDNDPIRATIAVLSGGIFNIFGDLYFVFTMDMGVFGAGLATAIGDIITIVILGSHFFSKSNSLVLTKVHFAYVKSKAIFVNGFSTFFTDIAMGIITVLFNRQILYYAGLDALAVYGVITQLATAAQSSSYCIGQAAQPLISINYGAAHFDRVKKTLKFSLITSAFFGLFWFGLVSAMPNVFVNIFMSPTESVLAIAPPIIRIYVLSFLFLPFNIFAAYYFQTILKPHTSFIFSIMRGLVLSGLFIIFLPLAFGADYIWFAMLCTEILIAIASIFFIKRYTAQLGK